MNMNRLIQVLPMLVMVAALAYAVYSIQPAVPTRPPAAAAATAGKQAPVEGTGQAVAETDTVRVAGRSPFQVGAKTGGSGDARNSTAEFEQTDPSLVALDGLTLEATFLQGRTRMAIIDGRTYEPGQNLVAANDETSPLVVTQVFMNKVIFQAGSKRYFLAYPDPFAPSIATTEDEPAAPGQGESPPGKGPQDPGSQLALIRALLNSPGGLGAGLTGMAGGGNLLADNAPRAKALGSRRGARPPGKGSRDRLKVKTRPRPPLPEVQ